MPNDAYSQLALAKDAGFQARIKGALLSVAADVLGEPDSTLNHGLRIEYANKVIVNPASTAAQATPFLVMRPNVNNFVTTTVFDGNGVSVINATGDADLKSQVSTDWDWLAAAASV
jgi:hypothetical protein